jgi:excisionase family DNA binding protein
MMTTRNDLLRLDEVAQIARVSVSTVRHWIKVGRLVSVRPGRRRLVRRAELERFLGNEPTGTRSEGARDAT